MGNIELLAPAGSFRALTAAVQSGADAVYLGGDAFSARQGADNFSLAEMGRAVEYCHLYGVNVHAAVNTLVKQKELSGLVQYIREITAIGIDAVIVQDMGAAKVIKSVSPDMPLHASTQMTVTSLEGVRALEALGFERVVLARELSEQEIRMICEGAEAEIEVFCHGALCICYSGQCLMSSVIGGRSGNRGRCAQPCRLPYTLMENGKEKTKGYLLSPKDLSLLDELPRLRKMGVASLKIEGRLKRPEYVAAVTGIYRKYLDTASAVSKEDRKELLDAFNRSGFTKAYFMGETGKAMMSPKTPGNQAENVFTEGALKRAEEHANIRKIPIDMRICIVIGEKCVLTVSDGIHTIVETGAEIAEYAQHRPLEKERIRTQMMKTGDTPFLVNHIQVDKDENSTVPIRELNSIRRSALEKLRIMRKTREKRRINPYYADDTDRVFHGLPKLTAEVSNAEQASAAVKRGIETIYVPARLYDEIHGRYPQVKVIAKLPEIWTSRQCAAETVMAENMAQIRQYGGREIYGDFRLNVYNAETVNAYRGLRQITLSPELNLRELREVISHTNTSLEIIGYGRLPLMLMKNCPIRVCAGECQNHSQNYALKDRMGEIFPIMCGEGCTARLLNTKPLFMADKIEDLIKLKINAIRLIFTVENSVECDTIINVYQHALEGIPAENPFEQQGFTRGHFYRGVQ